MGAGVAAGIGAAALVVAGAYLLSAVVAEVFRGGRSLAEVGPLLIVLVVIACVRAFVLFGAELAGQRGANRLTGALRRDLTARLFVLGPVHTSREHSGELSSVIVDGLAGRRPVGGVLSARAAARRVRAALGPRRRGGRSTHRPR